MYFLYPLPDLYRSTICLFESSLFVPMDDNRMMDDRVTVCLQKYIFLLQENREKATTDYFQQIIFIMNLFLLEQEGKYFQSQMFDLCFSYTVNPN